MYLIAGLGNPEKKYEATRHNIGFEAIKAFKEKYAPDKEKVKFHSLITQGTLYGEQFILMRPQTYMNNSGLAIGEAAKFYKIPADHVVILYDDIALPVGSLRLRKSGSAGGHNGIKSIIAHLGTQDFPRIRIGVGGKPQGGDLIAHVLGGFSKQDQPVMKEATENAAEAIATIFKDGMDKAMNLYNQKR